MSVTAPRQAWYPVAAGDEVDGSPRAASALGDAVVLWRAVGGAVAALEDCCAHRPYPLSLGAATGDGIRCGLCGFEYDTSGRCVRVPTQPQVPVGARVRAYPARERHGRVWLWLGDEGRASRHRIPDLPWLDGVPWSTVMGELTVAANFLLLHESFADVTKIPVLAPEIAPAALAEVPPPLDVEVSETTVSLTRAYPPAVLPPWQAAAVGAADGAAFAHRQEGHFLSPAAWVDHWDVRDGTDAAHRLRFTHLLTPLDDRTTRLAWFVSRDFGADDASVSAQLRSMFGAYYDRLAGALRHAQQAVDGGRSRREVNVSADAAALKVRDIVAEMVREEGRAPGP